MKTVFFGQKQLFCLTTLKKVGSSTHKKNPKTLNFTRAYVFGLAKKIIFSQKQLLSYAN